MRYIYNYLMIISLLLISCNDNNALMESTLPVEYNTDALMEYRAPASPDENFFIEFTITNPYDCIIESDQDWCKVVTDMADGVHTKLVIDRNPLGVTRAANVVISSPRIKGVFVIEVEQEASVFELKNLDIDYNHEGGKYKLYVSSDSPWTLESDYDWLSFDKTSGDETITTGEVEVNMTIKPNTHGIVRGADVKFRSKSGSEMITEVLQNEPWDTDVRVGDEGIVFDESQFDPSYVLYPQMLEWKTAGRPGGIPSLDKQINNPTITFGPEDIDEFYTYLEGSNKWGTRNIILKKGKYSIDRSIRLYSHDVLIGESKEDVIIELSGNASEITLYNGTNIGIRNLTIKGVWTNVDPDPSDMSETLSGKGNYKSITMSDTKESYIDNVRIINSASHAIRISGDVNNGGRGSHNTIRDVEINGAYNKGGDYQGFFHIGGAYNLVTGCKITNMRHISFQDQNSEYNVFYKNDVAQEVSFHDNDGGNNLVENNRITIPKTLGYGYTAIMGPWYSKHKVGGKNFVYRNKCLELNRDNNRSWSDNELYVGPWEVNPSDLYTNFRVTEEYSKPKAKTLYPVILK